MGLHLVHLLKKGNNVVGMHDDVWMNWGAKRVLKNPTGILVIFNFSTEILVGKIFTKAFLMFGISSSVSYPTRISDKEEDKSVRGISSM